MCELIWPRQQGKNKPYSALIDFQLPGDLLLKSSDEPESSHGWVFFGPLSKGLDTQSSFHAGLQDKLAQC